MKRIIAAIMVLGFTASAQAAPIYDSVKGRWLSSKSQIRTEVRQGININSKVSDAVLKRVGYITNAVVDAAPAGMVRIGWTVNVIDGVAHRVPITLTDAEYAAQQQAKETEQLQAVVDAAGAEIKQLEGIVDFFGLTRPVTVGDAIAEANAWIAAKEVEEDWLNTSRGARMSSTLLTLFSGLKDTGLNEATINAVWTYMVATGQDQ